MKLRSLKNHYFDNEYRLTGSVYHTNKVKGESLVKRGICEEIKTEKKERKPRRKKKER